MGRNDPEERSYVSNRSHVSGGLVLLDRVPWEWTSIQMAPEGLF